MVTPDHGRSRNTYCTFVGHRHEFIFKQPYFFILVGLHAISTKFRKYGSYAPTVIRSFSFPINNAFLSLDKFGNSLVFMKHRVHSNGSNCKLSLPLVSVSRCWSCRPRTKCSFNVRVALFSLTTGHLERSIIFMVVK